MQYNLSIQIIYLYLIFICNLFFGYGFQILNFFDIPLNYFFLIAGFFLFKINSSLLILKEVNLQIIVLIWIFYNFVKIIFGVNEYGQIAIRDASFSIDIFFLLISLKLFNMDDPVHEIRKLFKYCFIILIIFILAWFFKSFFRQFDIKVLSPTSQQSYLFFNFQTLSFLCAWFSFYLLTFENNKNFFSVVVFLLLTIFTLIIFQRRSIYLIYFSIFIFSLFYNPKSSLKLLAIILLGLLCLPLLNFANLIPEGYLGKADNIYFFIDHIKSIFSNNLLEYDNFKSTQGTAQIRIQWWNEIISTNFSNYFYLFFGREYGIPLTNFIGSKSIIIREPHNMYLTIFARTGIIGSLIYIILTIKLIKIWIKAFKLSKNKLFKNENKILIFLAIFIISIYSGCISDSMLTSNYYSIVFNISWSIIILVYLKLKNIKANENFTNSQ